MIHFVRMRPHLCVLLLIVQSTISASVSAQQSSVRITGRVTDSAGRGLAGVRILVANYDRTRFDSTRTTDNSRFSLVANRDSAGLLLVVRAVGFVAYRQGLVVVPSTTLVTLDIQLARLAPTLATVRVRAQSRPAVERPLRAAATPGASEAVVNTGFNDAQPGERGDLTTFATIVPGISAASSSAGAGVSVLGLPPATSSLSLGGAQSYVTRLPRDAPVNLRVTTTTFDVTRGGFSGANIDVAPLQGSNAKFYAARVTADPPFLQAPVRAGDSNIGTARRVGFGGAVGGPIVPDIAFFSGSAQLDYRESPVISASSLGRDGRVTDTAMVSNIQRAAAARSLGTPSGPTRRSVDFTSLGRIDLRPGTATSSSLIMSLQADRTSPISVDPQSFSSAGNTINTVAGSLGLVVEAGRGPMLHTTHLSMSGQTTHRRRIMDTPSVSVEVAGVDAPFLELLGGSPLPPTDSRAISASIDHTLAWRSLNGLHTYRLYSAARLDRSTQAVGGTESYAFSSPRDFAADQPSLYTRQSASETSGIASVVSVAFGDVWHRSALLGVQYGLRVDASSLLGGGESHLFPGTPRTAVVDLSPRLGATYLYGAQDGRRGRSGRIYGGVGRFVSAPDAILGGLLSLSTTMQTVCVGAAAPPLTNHGVTPPCSGDSVDAPIIRQTNAAIATGTLLPPASWRGNLGWSTNLAPSVFFSVEETVSLTRRLVDIYDANFADNPKGELPDGRPIYVNPSAISRSGIIPIASSRLNPALGRVIAQTSTQESFGLLNSVSIRRTFDGGRYVGLSYAETQARTRGLGFDVTGTAADPLRVTNAPSPYVSRHTVTVSSALDLRHGIYLQGFGRIQSGIRYTPIVGSDINGDGAANDRAYIPAIGDADVQLAEGIASLLHGTSGLVRACLSQQRGMISRAGSCQGPWTVTADATITLTQPALHLGSRATVNIDLFNLAAGADALLNGAHPRGWGQPTAVDPRLMFVTGYDPVAKQFQYTINQNFGSPPTSRLSLGNPFAVSVGVRVNLEHDRDQQLLELERTRARRSHSTALDEQGLLARLIHRYPNPAQVLLAATEDLLLDSTQTIALERSAQAYKAELDTLWTPVAASVASDWVHLDAAKSTMLIHDTSRIAASVFVRWTGATRAILTQAQLARLPELAAMQTSPAWVRLLNLDP